MTERDRLDQFGHMTVAMAQSWMCEAMRSRKKGDIARCLGVSPPYVSKLLHGGANLTMAQFGRVLAASGFEVRFHLVPVARPTRKPADRPKTTKEPR